MSADNLPEVEKICGNCVSFAPGQVWGADNIKNQLERGGICPFLGPNISVWAGENCRTVPIRFEPRTNESLSNSEPFIIIPVLAAST